MLGFIVMDNLTAIIIAILGSGLLSTALTLLTNRFRPSHRVDHLEAWQAERQLLETLEQQAGIDEEDRNRSGRDLALAIAARTQINASIAQRLIPKATLQSAGQLILGFVTAVLGPVIGVFGNWIVAAYDTLDMLILGWAFIILGVVTFFLLAPLLIFKGAKSDVYRNVMRAEVQRVLDNELIPAEKSLAEKYGWVAGSEFEYKTRHNITLPEDLRQSFAYFMQHAATQETQALHKNNNENKN